jgi:hypothetical protein
LNILKLRRFHVQKYMDYQSKNQLVAIHLNWTLRLFTNE